MSPPILRSRSPDCCWYDTIESVPILRDKLVLAAGSTDSYDPLFRRNCLYSISILYNGHGPPGLDPIHLRFHCNIQMRGSRSRASLPSNILSLLQVLQIRVSDHPLVARNFFLLLAATRLATHAWLTLYLLTIYSNNKWILNSHFSETAAVAVAATFSC